jgi:hypothetical protein
MTIILLLNIIKFLLFNGWFVKKNKLDEYLKACGWVDVLVGARVRRIQCD